MTFSDALILALSLLVIVLFVQLARRDKLVGAQVKLIDQLILQNKRWHDVLDTVLGGVDGLHESMARAEQLPNDHVEDFFRAVAALRDIVLVESKQGNERRRRGRE